MNINEEITLSNLWWNKGLRGFLFRDQATETLEELVNAVGGNSDPNAFSDLEDRIEQNYADVEDFEEDCYSESVEYLLENLGYDIDDDDDEDIEGCKGVGLLSDLSARFDSRASFNGKAKLDDNGKTIKLYNYNTEVASYSRTTGLLTVYGYFSATTARHIREFARQLGVVLPKGTDIAGQYETNF